MSDSREDSPDWLRSFTAPTQSVVFTLSSSSESDNDKEPSPMDEDGDFPSSLSDTSKTKSSIKRPKADQTKKATTKKKKTLSDYLGDKTDKKVDSSAKNSSFLALSSDSESPSNSPIRDAPKEKPPKKENQSEDPVPSKKTREDKSAAKKENKDDVDVQEEVIADKSTKSQFSCSRLPLVLSEKVNRTKALVECDGESIDLSGDVGAVGRVAMTDDPSGDQEEMLLDLKGTIYKTSIIPSRTFCVVSFGPSEAKIEAIMNDFIQLKAQSNVYEAETMVEGTLEGYLFDSEDEADKVAKPAADQTDQNGNEGNEEPPKKKAKTKAGKASGTVQRKGKATSAKPPPKKAKKKTQAPKKSRGKK